ncbi:hypothetical protein UFOVP1492_86 [uncultured Caudovirales phage]|uniref:Uncharacterized protein n=1 Tax=uncultured Caudovirales phage TaxID=2100421 RepID=A0A6J5RHU2_9CAUD|nr:hypothetical protein UFOVP1127_48 [uncultured Caudovirales phage]CAB4193121.1 hypothetical protein UFOVP1242_26 [uncultured Caudovirales phage]CAB4217777.1 hypothetical protein UFOVP1492_86 [uncultured Caudovirales phage]CAB5231599.1 hypothetical protein UFOVP1580_115 [uncultured Caudovirales phage]
MKDDKTPPMTFEEVVTHLCYYDHRNPNRVEMESDGKADCYCDNCFYGRTKLANALLAHIKPENSKPAAQFIIISIEGYVTGVHALNGQPVPYLIVNEDDLLALSADSDRWKPGDDFDAAV